MLLLSNNHGIAGLKGNVLFIVPIDGARVIEAQPLGVAVALSQDQDLLSIRVRSQTPRLGNELEDGDRSHQRVTTRFSDLAQNIYLATPYLDYTYGYLRTDDISLQSFRQLLSELIGCHTRHMHVSEQRKRYETVRTDCHRLGEIGIFPDVDAEDVRRAESKLR
jgi:hypothetical protein